MLILNYIAVFTRTDKSKI